MILAKSYLTLRLFDLRLLNFTLRFVGGLALLQTVRCLDCGEVYSKPAEGGTVNQNPGCPSCGYVGWLSVSLPSEPSSP